MYIIHMETAYNFDFITFFITLPESNSFSFHGKELCVCECETWRFGKIATFCKTVENVWQQKKCYAIFVYYN